MSNGDKNDGNMRTLAFLYIRVNPSQLFLQVKQFISNVI